MPEKGFPGAFNKPGRMGPVCGPRGKTGWGWGHGSQLRSTEAAGGQGSQEGPRRLAHPSRPRGPGEELAGGQVAEGPARLAWAQAEELMETFPVVCTGIF